MKASGGAPFALGEGLPHAWGVTRGSSGPATATTGYAPGAAGAVPGRSPGEGEMGEGLPHAWGGHRGGHPPGGNTASLLAVIDMQAFFATGSPWAVPGFESLIEPVSTLARGFGDRVVFTRFLVPAVPEGSWVGYYRAWPQVVGPAAAHLADLVPPWAGQELRTVDKTTFSKWGPELAAMTGTGGELTVCGVSTDCCVLATVLAAVDAGAQVRVVADACAGATAQAHEQALSLMTAFAPQVTVCSVGEELDRLADARSLFRQAT
jgi:nicotinamidase-related amidase